MMAAPHHENTPNQNELPSIILAQAEAAIIGNSDQVALANQDRLSTARQEPSQHLGVGHSTGSGQSSSKAHSETQSILGEHDEPPPAYGRTHDEVDLSQDGFDTRANVTDDGRVNINIHERSRRLSALLGSALKSQISLAEQPPSGYIPPALGGEPGQLPPPQFNVVIHVVGSRGDVQPFVALGKVLKVTYGHRVRLATHAVFKEFVEENGLEFFSIGGEPSELMAFMVKNPGLLPGLDSLKNGDIGKRRRGMEEIVLGCWRSCIEAGNGMQPVGSLDSTQAFSSSAAGINLDINPAERPFIADAIIANPPSFAHIHIAEKLGIPLHMMFTMPWSPTESFPHPLANIQSSNADDNMTNFVSYALVEMLTWQGLGDVINRFREKALGLDPISLIWAPGMLSRLRVPYTYCWSPSLIPKPSDWGPHISISGFYFLSLASTYTPEPALAEFLASGPPPIYIGFGSIVVDDPDGMTKLIFEAVKKTGSRALVSKGWGGLGADAVGIPNGVFMLGNVPHDWLFKHVSCVVHHGGAGTTAAGISAGVPTVVIPFFGDQPFWGAMVARAGAGPTPIPHAQLTSDKLAAAILEALKPEALAKARELGGRINSESGCEAGGKSFHDNLNVDSMRCSIIPSRVAVWRIKRTQTRLSALAATVLANAGLIDFADLKLYRPQEYETEEGPWDPISGGASALIGTIASLSMGAADFPIELFKAVKQKHTSVKDASRNTSALSSVMSLPAARSDSTLGSADDSQESRTSYSTDANSQGTPITSTSEKTSYESTDPRRLTGSTFATPTSTSSTLTLGHQRGNSLRDALRGALTRSTSRSRSHSRSRSDDGTHRSRPGSPAGLRREVVPSELTLETGVRAGRSVTKIVEAGLRSPMDFTLGLAKGFHNAPKLYGDDTVRPQEKVTDLQSGLKAAGKSFGLGMYDGISGLVTQPMRGAEKEGATGLIKGIGKGIGGLVLKPGAAIWSLPGYTFMGIHKEVRKHFGASVLNYIIAARTAQGYDHLKAASKEECQDIISRWYLHKEQYQSLKMKLQEQGGPEGQEKGRLTRRGLIQASQLPLDEQKKLHEQRKAIRESERARIHGGRFGRCPFCSRITAHSHTPRSVQMASSDEIAPKYGGHATVENAIRESVISTPHGDEEEDATTERAPTASMQKLRNERNQTLTEQEAIHQAVMASIVETQRGSQPGNRNVLSPEEVEHRASLERTIRQSLSEYHISYNDTHLTQVSGIEAPRAESDEDEDMKLAITASKASHLEEQEERRQVIAKDDILVEQAKERSLKEVGLKEPVEHQEGSTFHDADEDSLKKGVEESLKYALET